ncbi:SpoIIE family protein phosphatase [Crocinitomicaceae bacterium]|nr:SpoIIE family protein phosphatase [Crocinitomicaceae bacterium]
MTITQIESSLQSAKLVQEALLPKERHFRRLFEDSFVLYWPKEILSGDFYWIGQKNELRFIIVGDCTGHGISAALVSVLALNLFEYAVMNKGITLPHKILEEVDNRYIESFKDINEENFDNPWIDLSVVCIDDKKKRIQFAAANRKLLYVPNGYPAQVYKTKGYPLGGWQIRKLRSFSSIEIPYEKGSNLYLGSDGIQDQFGGEKLKKFGSSRLHQILKSNSRLPFTDQQRLLKSNILEWKQNEEQTDDICLIGIQV